jgi:hypothetical protein
MIVILPARLLDRPVSSLRPTVEIMAKPPSGSRRICRLTPTRAMFGKVGQGGIPVWSYFRNSLIISSLTSTAIAHRHRHGRRLCLRPLPLQGQGRAFSSA